MINPQRVMLAVVSAAVVAVATVTGGQAGTNDAGFKTSTDEMLALGPDAPTDSSVEALISVGDTMPGGYRFEAIPDGISLKTRGQGRVDVS